MFKVIKNDNTIELIDKIKYVYKQKNGAIIQCDKMAVKSINFLVEHYVLPHIDSLRRTVN